MSRTQKTPKPALAATFGRAAPAYDGAATVQRIAAERLARRLAALPHRPHPRILEIGCGTGFLGAALAPRLRAAEYVYTDLSEAMLRRARTRLGPASPGHYIAMDGERPCLRPGFYLVCSSLAFQWFEDPAASLPALADLLAPGGMLAFATLVEGSFAAWEAACAAAGIASGLRPLCGAEALDAICRSRLTGSIAVERLTVGYPDAAGFLGALKAIGAGLPKPNHAPVSPGALRRVLRGYTGGISIDYDIAYGYYVRD